MAAFDTALLRDALSREGFFSTVVDIDSRLLRLRFTPAPASCSLSDLCSPPEVDADLVGDLNRLRQRLQWHLGCQSGLPVYVVQGLLATFGYKRTPPSCTAEGLRALLRVPDTATFDWSKVINVLDDGGNVANCPLESTSADRVGQLETTVASLSASLRDLKLHLGQEVAQAIRASLAAAQPA